MSVYRIQHTVTDLEVNSFRRLRTSKLFEWIQELSITHTEALGMGKEKTLDQGLLWVVTMQRVKIARMPLYKETVTLETSPGKTMHVLFPRYYTIKDEQGNTLIEGSALWTLIDEKTRSFVFPESYGIHIEGEVNESVPLPSSLVSETCETPVSFTVPFSYTDINGHMNNTRYFDLLEDHFDIYRNIPKEIQTQYATELHHNDTVALHECINNHQYTYTGILKDKPAFTIRMDYE